MPLTCTAGSWSGSVHDSMMWGCYAVSLGEPSTGRCETPNPLLQKLCTMNPTTWAQRPQVPPGLEAAWLPEPAPCTWHHLELPKQRRTGMLGLYLATRRAVEPPLVRTTMSAAATCAAAERQVCARKGQPREASTPAMLGVVAGACHRMQSTWCEATPIQGVMASGFAR